MKKGAYSKFIVLVVILLNIIFTGAVLCIFLKIQSEPSTLIGCWFAFTTGELWALSSIKKKKIEKGGNEGEQD